MISGLPGRGGRDEFVSSGSTPFVLRGRNDGLELLRGAGPGLTKGGRPWLQGKA